jgi:hypothetical protein
MVLAVKNRVPPRQEEARTLGDAGEQMEEPLDRLTHREHAMRAVAVQEEGLAEDGERPVNDEKNHEGGHERQRNGPLSAPR